MSDFANSKLSSTETPKVTENVSSNSEPSTDTPKVVEPVTATTESGENKTSVSSTATASSRTTDALAWVEKDKAKAASAEKTSQAVPKVEVNVDDQLTSHFESALKMNSQTSIAQEESHLYVGKDATWRDQKFSGVPEAILAAIEKDLELPSPSPIQDLTIPHTILGKSVIAQAQTGSGKTIAFAVALLARVDARQEVTQALVVAPTRELALQIVSDAIAPLAKRMVPMPTIEMAVAGGDKIARGAKCKAQVVVGTSGKIKDLSSSSKKYLDFKTLKVMVLDEADMMVKSDGFRDDVTGFHSKCRADCQFLFFSATYPEDCEAYCRSLAPTAFLVKVPKNNLMIKHIFQVRMTVPMNGKVQMLKDAYEILGVESSIVFLDTVAEADQVSKMLVDEGFTVSTLHGRIEAENRDSIMDAFRRGDTKFLVTTDVLSRGVDVPAVSVVVNFTVPRSKLTRDSPNLPDSELYLHRIGRTGRYGRRGFAITLIENEQDERDLLAIEQAYGKERLTVPCQASFEHISALKEAIANMRRSGAP